MSGLSTLGEAAETARRLGLGGPLSLARDACDKACLRTGYLPLGHGDLGLRGLLRHRSYLASLTPDYERFSRYVFATVLAPGTVVVDGGAHIGLFSRLALARQPRIEALLAFEPDPYNFGALCLNVPPRARPSVRIANVALGERPGRAVFHVSSGTISSSLYERPDVEGAWTNHEVTVVALDDSRPPPGRLVVKLDLEGAEPAALRGMRDTLGRSSDVVVFAEANPAALHRGGHSVGSLLSELRTAGLEAFVVDERSRRLTPVDDCDEVGKGNLVAAKGTSVEALRELGDVA